MIDKNVIVCLVVGLVGLAILTAGCLYLVDPNIFEKLIMLFS